MFVKHECSRWQKKSKNLLVLYPPQGMWYKWGVSNSYMNLQSKFGNCITTQSLIIALFI